MSNPILSIILLIIFIILNILDAHSTWLVVNPHHYSRERNIFARFFFKKFGIVKGIILFKSLLIIFLAIIIAFYVLPEYLTLNVSILIGDIIFTFVVLNNYRIYRKISSRDE